MEKRVYGPKGRNVLIANALCQVYKEALLWPVNENESEQNTGNRGTELNNGREGLG